MAVGGKAETITPFLIKDFKGTVRNLSPSRLRLKNGLTVINKRKCLVWERVRGMYTFQEIRVSVKEIPRTPYGWRIERFPPRRIGKELDRLRPEAAVYGGGGRFAGEDKDVFYLCNCPVAYTESEGMAELVWEKDGWRLLQERWDGK